MQDKRHVIQTVQGDVLVSIAISHDYKEIMCYYVQSNLIIYNMNDLSITGYSGRGTRILLNSNESYEDIKSNDDLQKLIPYEFATKTGEIELDINYNEMIKNGDIDWFRYINFVEQIVEVKIKQLFSKPLIIDLKDEEV